MIKVPLKEMVEVGIKIEIQTAAGSRFTRREVEFKRQIEN